MIISGQPQAGNGFGRYSSEQYRKNGRLIHTRKKGQGGHLPNSQTYIYIYKHADVCEKNFNIKNDWWETSEMGSEMEGIRERRIGRFDTG